MGILKHLLLWPVTAPLALTRFSLRQVEKTAELELADDTRVKEELIEIQLLLEIGEIDEAEYARREAEALRRLREVREWQERLGLAKPWTPYAYGAHGEEGSSSGEV